jgi:nucleoside-diphosphate-sugar epimerase
MRADDGRMIPNFITQALGGRPLTVYGDGSQTRSIQYVDVLIEGTFRLAKSREARPVNMGNPWEYAVGEIAELVIELSGGKSEIVYEPLPADDPQEASPGDRACQGGLRLGAARGGARRTDEDYRLVRRTLEQIRNGCHTRALMRSAEECNGRM